MEKYFDIRYEFDVPMVHKSIAEHIVTGKPGYICAADGNILAMVHNNNEYRNVVDDSMFSICDSSWVPVFVKWIYGYNRKPYCGSDIFFDVLRQHKYRMIFLGTKQNVLDALQQNLAKDNPDVASMTFKELPFCNVEEFDYKGIARMIEHGIFFCLFGPPEFVFPVGNKRGSHIGRQLILAVAEFSSSLTDDTFLVTFISNGKRGIIVPGKRDVFPQDPSAE